MARNKKHKSQKRVIGGFSETDGLFEARANQKIELAKKEETKANLIQKLISELRGTVKPL